MTDSPAIRAEDLVKEYGDLRALDEVSLTVERGEFFGLLGPNGAGKTTFIDTLVGLADITGGEAAVFGHDVQDERGAVRDRIGIAPQEYNVDRFFPIREVLEHAAGYHGFDREEAQRRADDVLEQVGLTEKADEKFHHLSGGMKRRCLLARALVVDPDLLILDEPTAGVDVQLRRDIWDVVRNLNDDGTTILLTTHYIEEAERLCDRVCILDDGRPIEIDTPQELRRKGTDTFRIDIAGSAARTAALRDIDEVVSVTERAGGLTVRARRSKSALPDVITALDDAGHEVTGVDIERASLEEVFVDLTRAGEGDERSGDDDTDAPEGEVADASETDPDRERRREVDA